MKKFITTLTSIFIAAIVMAQVPNVMNYQAVARNNAGQALTNQSIKVRLSVVKNTVSQYSETRQVTTNALGLFNVQIGSTGALSTTGNFSTIDWQNNTAPVYVLKVELDINNSGLFTDMGSQALVTVPFSFASKTADEATETVNIAGRPIDQTTAPATGARLSWNGTSWTPVKKDTVYNFNSPSVPSPMTQQSNFAFFNDITPSFLVNSSDRIVANMQTSVANATPTTQLDFQLAMCYQNVIIGSPVVPFSTTNIMRAAVPPATNSPIHSISFISASGAITLPPGTYKIGLGIKVLTPGRELYPTINGGVNGTIEIRH